jgi:3-hydroxy-9,10-secoandrosta-1,3,5(10)-triene-9,17-dione monooxygenase reductase component
MTGSLTPELDPLEFRRVLGHFATGVVAITAIDPATRGGPVGLAANSFTSVSLEPPLVAFCVAHTSASWPVVRTADRFCVNILAEGQDEICRALARTGADKFAGVDWAPSPSGAPVIPGVAGWIEASVETEHPAGDHVIVVARVHALGAEDRLPLLFFRGMYGRISA